MQQRRLVAAWATLVLAVACTEEVDPTLQGDSTADASDGVVRGGSADATAEAATPVSPPAPGGTGATGSGAPGGNGATGSGSPGGTGAIAGSTDGGQPARDGAVAEADSSGPGGILSGTGAVTGGTFGGFGGIGAPPPPPPGCRDGGPISTSWIADDRTFVISSAKQACGAPASAAKRPENDCAFPLRYVTYRVPTLSRAGTYQVGRDASIVVEREFPTGGDDSGCVCRPSIDTPRMLASGSIEIKPFPNGTVAATITTQDEELGILIGPCAPVPQP